MKKLQKRFDDFIALKSLKHTHQRNLIFDVFLNSDGHLSTEELYEKIKSIDSSVGQATVYRTMKLLCEAGIAHEIHFGDGLTRYEVDDSGKKHHDHLICTVCGKIFEFVDELIEQRQKELAKKYDFDLTSHRMYLYGVCADCRKKI
ncbi:Fur family transcriptional regulator [Desulfovibrio litoralis]|uniref:Ferric uptake regulation protein n=1 Tax=Desulfovibrio litoralis DSM 11393 TaxID=1121455 RepID=A0A1M7S9E3_9BACT|nr:transcriptional repressor [Desulfovibrio litoralis]SHN55096.1 ferric uptake regulator, Fur family [Desulfovibrio litoralis DSM 11393]